MSRRRQEGAKKPDLGFEVPDFDEAEFIRKETISFRTTLILFLYSILTALVTFFVWAYVAQSWALALLVGLGLGAALRVIYPALKVDISHFKRKEWVGTGFLYFFSWLAFLIFFVNPPVYDGVAPHIEIHVTPDVQSPGRPVEVTIVALDNVAVDTDSLDFEVRDAGGTVIADTSDLTPGNHTATWTWKGTPAAATYTIDVRISDTGSGLLQPARHTTTKNAALRVEADPVRVFLTGQSPDDVTTARFTSPDDTVRVEIPDIVDVYRAWLQTTNGTQIQLEPVDDADRPDHTVWRAEADFTGWTTGNNSFTVHVQEHDAYYLEARYGLEAPATELVSATTYTVVIDDDRILGEDKAGGLPKKRSAQPVQTPGPDIALLVGTIAIAAIVVNRKRAA